jgi:tetratricopeptide (TPR) repeat protein
MGRIAHSLLIAMVTIPCAGGAMAQEPAQAIGAVFSRSIDGASSGNGFFIGDGTWLVTARQVVYPSRRAGLHQGETMVTVLSPYLGEAAEANVVAQDQDVVLLRVPWKGHPALVLAEESEVFAAAQVQIIAYPQMPSSVQIARESRGVSGVVVRQSVSRTLLTAAAPTGPGWAGAPMLIADGKSVAGCYVRTQADGSAGAGAAVGLIRRMIQQTGVTDALRPASQPIPSPLNALEATTQYLNALTASSALDASKALQHFQAYLKLRPGSAMGHRDAAGELRALQRFDESQVMYANALELNPQLVSARVLYGQLLHDRIMPRAAEEHLRYAWRHGRSNAAVIPLCNVLREQRKEAECLQILDQALKQSPRDGHLWNYVGQNRRAIDDHAGAGSAFARAAELLGDDEASRIQSAQAFDAAGQTSRAEEQYRLAIQRNDASGPAHYFLARLIARDRSRHSEALKHAEMALNLSGHAGAPPRDVVQSLISAIRTGRVAHADELRL